MVEEAAPTVWLAMQMGEVEDITSEEVAANYDRHQHHYGAFLASRPE